MEEKQHLILSLNEGYNRWSAFYDEDDIPLHLLEQSVVEKALGDVNGLEVLDVGCGTGRQTWRLAGRGARIVGLDQSEGMLERAQQKKLQGEVRFLKANADDPFPFPDNTFDRVVSFLALEHIEKLSSFFSECRRLCRPQGFLYFTAMHPALVLKGVQARFTVKNTGQKVYPKSHPYQISDYVNAAVLADLRLASLTEHAAGPEHAIQSERAKKYEGWPLLLTLTFLPNKRVI